jgi:hypothetical protein
MKMISRVVGRQELRGIRGIVRRRILIDDAIAAALRAADESIDFGTPRLARWRPISRSLEWRQCRAQKFESGGVRARDDLAHGRDQLVRVGRAVAEIVDRIVREDYPTHARL